MNIALPAALQPALTDPFGRAITYLRVSVTDRCDFRCVYCMAEDQHFLPKRDLLTLEELDRLTSAFVARGVRKVRLTGGEPLVRKNVMELVRSLSRHLGGGLDEITLTTNGSQLARFAGELAEAGVRRINVSLDTLDAEKFRAITRWGDLDRVLAGIAAARAAGLAVKINAVALKGVNEDEIEHLMRWAHGDGMDLTLIETMPLGEVGVDRTDQYLPLSLVRARLAERFTLNDLAMTTGGPARYVAVKETGGRLGFITPLTHNFCESCNRVRVTCTGTLYMCLGQEDAADLRAPLRASEGDEALQAAITAAIAHKPKGHDFIIDRAHRRPAVARTMSVTGGIGSRRRVEGGVERARQFFPAIRLLQDLRGGVAALRLQLAVGEAAGEDHAEAGPALAGSIGQLVAGLAAGHDHIGEQEIDRLILQDAQRASRVGRLQRTVAEIRQLPHDEAAERRDIIHRQDSFAVAPGEFPNSCRQA